MFNNQKSMHQKLVQVESVQRHRLSCSSLIIINITSPIAQVEMKTRDSIPFECVMVRRGGLGIITI